MFMLLIDYVVSNVCELLLPNRYGPYSQRDFKPRLTKYDFNDFSIGDKIDT